VAALVAEVLPDCSSGYAAYGTTFRGMGARVWRLPLTHQMGHLELRRAYSRFAVAHPNIAAMLGVCIQPGAEPADDGATGAADGGALWVVEERFSCDTLHGRLERGLLSWQQALQVAGDLARAVAYLQGLRKLRASSGGSGLEAGAPAGGCCLSHAAAASLVNPAHVLVSGSQAKVCLVPAMLATIEAAHGGASAASAAGQSWEGSAQAMAYVDPLRMLTAAATGGQQSLDCFYAYGVVLLQLLTEQAPMGLVGAIREALGQGSLPNLVPRLPVSDEASQLAEGLARLALRCVQMPGTGDAPGSMEADVLPALAALQQQLPALGGSAMSWEQVEELLMLPLQPSPASDAAGRRWVRHDFRARKKAFLEEVGKLAVEGPIHKIEVRRSRCFKDSVATFSGKGQNVWRQPLKVTFVGEAGMDSGGVTREWFSSLSSALSRGSLDLFWKVGAQKNSLYINPMSASPSHLKRFHFVGLFMAKALLETAARTKELGPISLNLRFCEPFWKLLLGIPLSLVDLQSLDPTEFRSIVQVLGMDIEGVIFENFTWSFEHASKASAKDEPEVPALPSTSSPFTADAQQTVVTSIPLKPGGSHVFVTNANKREYVLLKAYRMLCSSVEAQMTATIDAFHSLIPRELLEKYSFTPQELQLLVCGEQHIDIADLKAHCKWVARGRHLQGLLPAGPAAPGLPPGLQGLHHARLPLPSWRASAPLAQPPPRLLQRTHHQRTPLPPSLDLSSAQPPASPPASPPPPHPPPPRYEDGYSGKEDQIVWLWQALDTLDDSQLRALLQFWSGSDGMPAEGFGNIDPAFHIVAVDRMYDRCDRTARLPAAHTCFRQLDLPRYRSYDELREKLLTAITMGQGYMALS
jgi:E3 ubiquitin-protein ligase HUWE1